MSCCQLPVPVVQIYNNIRFVHAFLLFLPQQSHSIRGFNSFKALLIISYTSSFRYFDSKVFLSNMLQRHPKMKIKGKGNNSQVSLFAGSDHTIYGPEDRRTGSCILCPFIKSSIMKLPWSRCKSDGKRQIISNF